MAANAFLRNEEWMVATTFVEQRNTVLTLYL